MLKSLRTNIALNLAVLLLIAMLLIDLVALFVTQEMLIASRAEKGRVLMAALSTHLMPAPSGDGNAWRIANHAKINPLVESAGGALFFGGNR